MRRLALFLPVFLLSCGDGEVPEVRLGERVLTLGSVVFAPKLAGGPDSAVRGYTILALREDACGALELEAPMPGLAGFYLEVFGTDGPGTCRTDGDGCEAQIELFSYEDTGEYRWGVMDGSIEVLTVSADEMELVVRFDAWPDPLRCDDGDCVCEGRCQPGEETVRVELPLKAELCRAACECTAGDPSSAACCPG